MNPLSDILSLLKPSSYGFRGLDASGDWALAYAADDGITLRDWLVLSIRTAHDLRGRTLRALTVATDIAE